MLITECFVGGGKLAGRSEVGNEKRPKDWMFAGQEAQSLTLYDRTQNVGKPPLQGGR